MSLGLETAWRCGVKTMAVLICVAATVAVAVAVVVGGGISYVRLAPSLADRWHVDPVAAPKPARSGFFLRVDQDNTASDPASVLAHFQEIALRDAQTKHLFGSVQSGMITFVSRSRIWGFPDYTTVKAHRLANGQTSLVIYGRLRFGRSDFGVNRGRITGWVQAMQSPQ